MIELPGVISPIAITMGPFRVHWYGIAYAVSFLVLYIGVRSSLKKSSQQLITLDMWESLFQRLTLAVIVGGRLGYILFYQPTWLLEPWRILMIWQGGMSFHGACLGVGITTWLFCYHHRCSFIHIMDLLLPWVPVGLFLGRLANFVNGELPGRVTEVSWAVIFKHTDWLPRHPSPLYEALGEGVCLGVLLYCVTKLKRKGMVTCSFLMGYGLIRSVLECFREPDPQIGYLWSYFTLGQFLSMAMIVVSMVMVFMVMRPSLRYHKHQQKAC